MGAAGASSIIAILFLRNDALTPDGQWLVTSIVILGFWVCIFLLKYAAGYALWYQPYKTRTRAVSLSVAAVLAVYIGGIGCIVLLSLFEGRTYTLETIALGFYEFSKYIFGLPYLAAAIVGWCFARPAPDLREHF